MTEQHEAPSAETPVSHDGSIEAMRPEHMTNEATTTPLGEADAAVVEAVGAEAEAAVSAEQTVDDEADSVRIDGDDDAELDALDDEDVQVTQPNPYAAPLGYTGKFTHDDEAVVDDAPQVTE